MQVQFTKMHGAGNDFVVIDARVQTAPMSAEVARHIADRRTGIGCDQILLIEAASQPEADFAYRIFNAAGGEVEQCGNGARALALFGHTQANGKTDLLMQSPAGPVRARVNGADQIAVDMGRPDFEPAALPFAAAVRASEYQLDIDNELIRFGAVSMGNPHAVVTVKDISSAPVATIGPALQRHAAFPRSVNVGFVQILSRSQVALRVYERGVGETQACGTGACAAIAVACEQGFVDNSVRVNLPGGHLMIDFAKLGEAIWLTGPAIRAFEGHIEL